MFRYRHVWEIDREDTITVFVKKKPNLKDFEDELVKYSMAQSQLTTEKIEYRYGSILIDCAHLVETIDLEIKQWISIYGKAMQVKYKREMDFIVAQVRQCRMKREGLTTVWVQSYVIVLSGQSSASFSLIFWYFSNQTYNSYNKLMSKVERLVSRLELTTFWIRVSSIIQYLDQGSHPIT